MGTPRAAATSLDRLLDEGHEISAVYTQPDRPSGRGKKIAFSPVKELALTRNLRVLQPIKIKTNAAVNEFRSLGADIAVVVAYGRILPESFLSAFPRGAINVHFSLLPKYRGAAPVNWAIVNGETQTGVTTMKMDAGLDTGDILLQRSTAIGSNENAVALMDRLAEIGADLLTETLADIASLSPRKQDEASATFAPILKKEDGLINWASCAADIARRVRGFQPFPTSYTFHETVRLTIWEALVAEVDRPANAGSVTEASGDTLVISCGNGTALLIKEIQPEGKRRMRVRDFLNGAKLKTGDMLSSVRSELQAAIR
jgi:methionyl-tRNA formyltransferase